MQKNKIYLAFQGGFVSFWEVAVVEVWFLTLENVSMVKDSEVPSWFIQWNLLSWTELLYVFVFNYLLPLVGVGIWILGKMDWFVVCRVKNFFNWWIKSNDSYVEARCFDDAEGSSASKFYSRLESKKIKTYDQVWSLRIFRKKFPNWHKQKVWPKNSIISNWDLLSGNWLHMDGNWRPAV